MNADADGRREAMVPAMFAQCPLDRHGARKGCGGVGEHDEEAVACVVDFLACVVGEQRAQRPIVPLDEVEPGLVTDRLDETRRPADVAEEKGGHRRIGVARS